MLTQDIIFTSAEVTDTKGAKHAPPHASITKGDAGVLVSMIHSDVITVEMYSST